MLSLRIAWRELRRSWRFGLFFIFNLSLGLTGFVSLEAFKAAIQKNIESNAKIILSADIEVWARRPFTPEEHKQIRAVLPTAPEGVVYQFFAMLNAGGNSRLVSVKAIDAAYPFYGELEMGSGQKITHDSDKDILREKNIWIYPELRTQLGLKNGDEVRLGRLHLKVSDSVEKDGTQTFRAASLAPRVFINRALLPESGLIQFGSTFSMSYLYRLPAGVSAAEVRSRLYEKLTDASIQVETPQSAGEDSGRQLGYLSDYLGLVAIIALFMSVLGASYIYRLYLTQKLKEIAIFRTLGLQSRQAVGIYVLQILMLGALATVPTLILTTAVLPLLSRLLARLTPFSLQPSVSPWIFAVSLGMALLGSFVVSFPFLRKIRDLRPAKLFSEEKFAPDMALGGVWPFLPAVILFWLLAVYQAHSWWIGGIFIAALAAVLVALGLVAWLGLQLLLHVRLPKTWFIKFSLLGLRRRRAASFAIFIAVGLGSLLMNILPQLKVTLQSEFILEGGAKLPSLFMFDIQDEQIQPLLDALKQKKITATLVSPMVRARILKVNGKDYERKLEDQKFQTREEERDARFRNRGVNLSYRPQLSDSEIILEGKKFSGPFDPSRQKYAELSVEYKYAERVGLHIHDILEFDIQGVRVQGEIINLRKVKWTSFQPNFFILMQDGVLNEAPKTYIAAVPALPPPEKSALQTQLASRFPNVSILDVGRVVADLLNVATQMSWSLELMAALALLTGYIVLFSIVRAQLRQRRWELNMLKVLGASGAGVSGFILIESLALTLLSSLAGALLSLIVSDALAIFVFESEFKFDLFWPVISVIGITLTSLLVAFIAGLDIVREKPLQILRSDN